MRKVKIAVAQLQGYWPEEMPVEKRIEENMGQFEIMLDRAASESPDLVAVGECFNHNDIPRENRDYSEDIESGRAFQIASKAAKKGSCNIVYGINGTHNGLKRNCAVIVDRTGAFAGVYYKVQLTQGEKNGGVTPGDEFPVFKLDFGAIGVITCHDMSFPESARCLMLNGAELIIWPTMWSGWGDELSNTVIKSRCIDNSVYLVMTSTGQNPDAINWVGGVKSLSAIYNHEGKIVCQTADRLPGVLVGEIDLDFKRIAPWFTLNDVDPFLESVLSERRPEAYRPITDPELSEQRRTQLQS